MWEVRGKDFSLRNLVLNAWRTLPGDFSFSGWPLIRAKWKLKEFIHKFPQIPAAHMTHAAVTLLEVPEGRQKIARRFNGGFGRSNIAAPEGRHRIDLVPPLRGLAFFTLRSPTARAVGYVLSSLTGLTT